MKYITFQEGFLDDIKNRVQTNIGNASSAVSNLVNKVKGVGQGVTNFANRAQTKVNNVASALGAKGFSGNPTSEGQKQMQTALIKRQIPNGPTNTTGPLPKQ
jgi:uncharacterized protein YoxC